MIRSLDLSRLNTEELTNYSNTYLEHAQSFKFDSKSQNDMKEALVRFLGEYMKFRERVGSIAITDRMAKMEKYLDHSFLYLRYSIELFQLKMYGKPHPQADRLMDVIYDHDYDLHERGHKQIQEALSGIINDMEGNVDNLVALNMLDLQEAFEDMQWKLDRFNAWDDFRKELDVDSPGDIKLSDARKRLIVLFKHYNNTVENNFYEGDDKERLCALEDRINELNDSYFSMLMNRHKKNDKDPDQSEDDNDNDKD